MSPDVKANFPTVPRAEIITVFSGKMDAALLLGFIYLLDLDLI